jgi:phosphohistidine phosphatase SixA
MRRTVLLCLVLLTGLAASAAAQPAVFLVRHAERADTPAAGGMMATDPELSEAGHARAQSLASALKDAGITAIYVTQFKRTQQTAAPLARALGLKPIEVNSKDLNGLAEKIKAQSGNVLVVGHSNSVPNTIKALGVASAPDIPETDFDNLFVVTLGARPSIVRLHYK